MGARRLCRGQSALRSPVPPAEDVRTSLQHVATLPDQPDYLERADGGQEFALWLRLADQRAAAAARETGRAPRIGQSQFP